MKTILLLASMLLRCLQADGTPRADALPADAPPAVEIAPQSEPGRRLTFSGRVLDYRGEPLSRAAVIAYNTDARGYYNPPNSKTRTPRLRAVAVTDDDGRFRFSTVWPGAYPNGAEPAHVHLGVMAPAHRERYVDIWFDGDPLITAERRARAQSEGNTMIVEPEKDGQMWTFRIDVKLEAN